MLPDVVKFEGGRQEFVFLNIAETGTAGKMTLQKISKIGITILWSKEMETGGRKHRSEVLDRVKINKRIGSMSGGQGESNYRARRRAGEKIHLLQQIRKPVDQALD